MCLLLCHLVGCRLCLVVVASIGSFMVVMLLRDHIPLHQGCCFYMKHGTMDSFLRVSPFFQWLFKSLDFPPCLCYPYLADVAPSEKSSPCPNVIRAGLHLNWVIYHRYGCLLKWQQIYCMRCRLDSSSIIGCDIRQCCHSKVLAALVYSRQAEAC